MMSGPGCSEPGVTTLRLPDTCSSERDSHARDVELEVGFVCKKCRGGWASEASLLAHQRQCYPAQQQPQRGAFRLVQPGLECKLCQERLRSAPEYRKHVESHQPHQPPPAESPLSHEMEDVVNQITLLAARAAQERFPTVQQQDNPQPQPQPLTTGH